MFDALITSDPASGGTIQVGLIAGPPRFPSSASAVVTINPGSAAAGTYLLRFVTRLPDGIFDAAEAALMIH